MPGASVYTRKRLSLSLSLKLRLLSKTTSYVASGQQYMAGLACRTQSEEPTASEAGNGVPSHCRIEEPDSIPRSPPFE